MGFLWAQIPALSLNSLLGKFTPFHGVPHLRASRVCFRGPNLSCEAHNLISNPLVYLSTWIMVSQPRLDLGFRPLLTCYSFSVFFDSTKAHASVQLSDLDLRSQSCCLLPPHVLPHPPPAPAPGLVCLTHPVDSLVAHLGLPELLPLCPGISRLDPCWSLLTSPRWAVRTVHTETSSQNAPPPTLGKPRSLARLPAPPHLQRWAAPGPAPALHLAFWAAVPLPLIPGLVRRRAWHLLIPLPAPASHHSASPPPFNRLLLRGVSPRTSRPLLRATACHGSPPSEHLPQFSSFYSSQWFLDEGLHLRRAPERRGPEAGEWVTWGMFKKLPEWVNGVSLRPDKAISTVRRVYP